MLRTICVVVLVAGWGVVDRVDAALVTVDIDSLSDDTVVTSAFPGITIRSWHQPAGSSNFRLPVIVHEISGGNLVFADRGTVEPFASTPTKFGSVFNPVTANSIWFELDFSTPTDFVSVDIVSPENVNGVSVYLELATSPVTSTTFNPGAVSTIIIDRPSADVWKVRIKPASGVSGQWGRGFFDNLMYNDPSLPEPPPPVNAPEPSTFALAALGLLGLGFVALRKKYRRA